MSKGNSKMEFDCVIVGGGSAGSVLAGRLSTRPDTRVCLIEAGPSDDNVFCRVPIATALFVSARWRNWAFATVPQSALNNRVGYQPRGRMLGGSSGINAMISYGQNIGTAEEPVLHRAIELAGAQSWGDG